MWCVCVCVFDMTLYFSSISQVALLRFPDRIDWTSPLSYWTVAVSLPNKEEVSLQRMSPVTCPGQSKCFQFLQESRISSQVSPGSCVLVGCLGWA